MYDSKGRNSWGGLPVAGPALDEIKTAAVRLANWLVRTPLIPFAADSLFLKPEVLQPTGAYKVRGVYNWAASLSEEQRRRGLSTHTSGNTALALGYVARHYGLAARSLMPDSVPKNKVDAIRQLGVEPVLLPIEELLRYVFEERWREEPYCFLNPWADPHMLAGNGTVGLEILADLPEAETVFIPVGGGGLVAGVGSALRALKPDIRIIAVQSENCPALAASFEAGRAVWIEPKANVCDGTALPLVVAEMYALLRELIDEVVLVADAEVKEAMRRLAKENKLVVEGSGAMSVAAALKTPAANRGESVCILSGGSVKLEFTL